MMSKLYELIPPMDNAQQYKTSINHFINASNINTSKGPLARYTIERDNKDDSLTSEEVTKTTRFPNIKATRQPDDQPYLSYPIGNNLILPQNVVRFIFKIDATGNPASHAIASVEKSRSSTLNTPWYRTSLGYGTHKADGNFDTVKGPTPFTIAQDAAHTDSGGVRFTKRRNLVRNNSPISELNLNRRYQKWRTLVLKVIEEFEAEEIPEDEEELNKKNIWYSKKHQIWFILEDYKGSVLSHYGISTSSLDLAVEGIRNFGNPGTVGLRDYPESFAGENYQKYLAKMIPGTLAGINHSIEFAATRDIEPRVRNHIWELIPYFNNRFDEVPVNVVNVVLYRDLGIPRSTLGPRWFPDQAPPDWDEWSEQTRIEGSPIEVDGSVEKMTEWVQARYEPGRDSSRETTYAFNYLEDTLQYTSKKAQGYLDFAEFNKPKAGKNINLVFLDTSEISAGEKMTYAYPSWWLKETRPRDEWAWELRTEEGEVEIVNGEIQGDVPDWLSTNEPKNSGHDHEFETEDDAYWESAMEDFEESKIFENYDYDKEEKYYQDALDKRAREKQKLQDHKAMFESDDPDPEDDPFVDEDGEEKDDLPEKDEKQGYVNVSSSCRPVGWRPTDPDNTDPNNPESTGKVLRPIIYTNFPEPEDGLYSDAFIRSAGFFRGNEYIIYSRKVTSPSHEKTISFRSDPWAVKVDVRNVWDQILEHTKETLKLYHPDTDYQESKSIKDFHNEYVDDFDDDSYDQVTEKITEMLKGAFK